MAVPEKATIYVDIDDEITAVIDKVQNSKGSLVALVLPKRASVFQSIVNIKLLKRAADSANKKLILITAEAGLLPLAGAAGIHVAKTLNSKPEIPLSPNSIIDDEETQEGTTIPLDNINETDANLLDKNETVGKLAAKDSSNALKVSAKTADIETLDLDNTEPEPKLSSDSEDGSDKHKSKKNKSLKVPKFSKLKIFLSVITIILLIAIIGFALISPSLAHATVDISTNATSIPLSLDLSLSPGYSSVNTASSELPANYVQTKKTFTASVATTGQVNNGNKANGSITITAGQCSVGSTTPPSLPAGTGASANNQTYIIEDQVDFYCPPPLKNNQQAEYVGYDSNNSNNGNNIPIIAQSGGSIYNVSNVSFTIADNAANYSATGSASGGTDNIVQVVNQNDITNAENKISTGNSAAVKTSLESQLDNAGYYPVHATFTSSNPVITPSTAVGSPANNVTVTETITYSMYGIHLSDLKSIIASNIDNQINTSKQSILDYGISSASYNVSNQTAKVSQISFSTNVVAGPHLNVTSIKKQIAGQKAGNIKSDISNDPNVTGVIVKFSPFWVGSAPKNINRIDIVIEKPTKK